MGIRHPTGSNACSAARRCRSAIRRALLWRASPRAGCSPSEALLVERVPRPAGPRAPAQRAGRRFDAADDLAIDNSGSRGAPRTSPAVVLEALRTAAITRRGCLLTLRRAGRDRRARPAVWRAAAKGCALLAQSPLRRRHRRPPSSAPCSACARGALSSADLLIVRRRRVRLHEPRCSTWWLASWPARAGRPVAAARQRPAADLDDSGLRDWRRYSGTRRPEDAGAHRQPDGCTSPMR